MAACRFCNTYRMAPNAPPCCAKSCSVCPGKLGNRGSVDGMKAENASPPLIKSRNGVGACQERSYIKWQPSAAESYSHGQFSERFQHRCTVGQQALEEAPLDLCANLT